MFPYAVTIFTSASLLFLVQPLIARQILPWFGGAASVWTTCLVFFQTVLLLGYAYAHASTRWLSARRQALVHAVLLMASCAWLPIIPSAAWRPTGHEDPSWRILGLLASTIGLPYLLLSSTTPLLQVWYWRRFQSRVPYRLFALSNLASLLALLGFPLIVEPYAGVSASARVWSCAYAGFALLCGGLVAAVLRRDRGAQAHDAELSEQGATPLGVSRVAYWLLLSTAGSCLLLAISNHITQNIAAMPLLWVVPLALYLVSFIICFERPGWYLRGPCLALLGVLLVVMAYRINAVELPLVAPLFASGLFVGCMVCHGELARHKPEPQHMTLYYLMIALGGALGAGLIALAAPLLLRGYFELHLVLVLLAVLVCACVWRSNPLVRSGALAVLASVLWLDGRAIAHYTKQLHDMQRDFYGVVRIRDWHGPPRVRIMLHGGINHGGQYLEPGRAMEPTGYVGLTSGYGRLLRALPGPRKIGVLGLGSAALLSYARAEDHWVFYEIDPLVVEITRRHFSYERQTAARVEHVLGDGRLSLEREPPRGYDMLAIDAFSGDAVPMHLLTRQAMATYVKHIRPSGAIVFQATNRFVDLLPVIRRLADEFGLQTRWIDDHPEPRKGYFALGTDQVILTKNSALLDSPSLRGVGEPAPDRPDLPTFSDDFYNVLRILKF